MIWYRYDGRPLVTSVGLQIYVQWWMISFRTIDNLITVTWFILSWAHLFLELSSFDAIMEIEMFCFYYFWKYFFLAIFCTFYMKDYLAQQRGMWCNVLVSYLNFEASCVAISFCACLFPNGFQVLNLRSSNFTVYILMYMALKHCYLFLELQTNIPTTQIYIMSYIDILQVLHLYCQLCVVGKFLSMANQVLQNLKRKQDAMDLLATNLNEWKRYNLGYF
jgi:hypothetical protein